MLVLLFPLYKRYEDFSLSGHYFIAFMLTDGSSFYELVFKYTRSIGTIQFEKKWKKVDYNPQPPK